MFYEKIEKLENIDLIMDVYRLKIVNNNEENIYIILDKFMDKKVYEVDDVKQGLIDFHDFLSSHNIKYKESIRKSKRAFDNRTKEA